MSIFDGAGPPSPDEVEVTVLGPGFGECIVVHLGNGEWMIVDSCRERSGCPPAAQAYLESIGVKPDQVKYILVSHWHDDHTKGISELAAHYNAARIGVSTVLSSTEGKTFLTAYSGRVSELSRGTAELYKIFKEHKARIEALAQNRMVLTGDAAKGIPFTVTALSPTDQFYLESRAILQQLIPSPDKPTPQKEAPALTPNNEAVVVHISVGGTAVLLGSDLETSRFGWTVVCQNPHVANLRRAELYKVAHHGSETAECETIWKNLLAPKPVSVLTPFHHGRHRLPNNADRQRILGNSAAAHISSRATARSSVDSRILRRLEAMGSKPMPLHSGFGAVRSRKQAGSDAPWQVAHFGSAGVLQPI